MLSSGILFGCVGEYANIKGVIRLGMNGPEKAQQGLKYYAKIFKPDTSHSPNGLTFISYPC